MRLEIWTYFCGLNYKFIEELNIKEKSMKNFKIMMIALVAMVGFISCEQPDTDGYDHSADLVGTWTCLTENYAEALIIKADGSVVSYGVEDGEYWENIAGQITVNGGNIKMIFEDDDNFEGHFDVIPGMAFSVHNDNDERYTYKYCANDLADEIVGMWVCTDGPANKENDMLIQIFNEDGTSVMTGDADELLVNDKSTTYKVIGDLLLLQMNKESVSYVPFRMTYSPDATTLGDVMTLTLAMKNAGIKSTATWLRIKQSLDLAGQNYDYIKTFVTNVKGEDKDVPFLDTSFNFAKMDGSIIDKFLKSILFKVEFPDANTIKYSYLLEGKNYVMTAPIEVEENKMTIKMSANENTPFYQDVVVYTFQDKDNTQMHWYMPTSSFEKFFANTSVAVMLGHGQLDPTDPNFPAALAEVYQTVAEAVWSINLSLVMTKIE